MSNTSLYPLRFNPIYQYRLWGGHRLADFLSEPMPPDEPIGEAWLLSDRNDHPSTVANGQFAGYTITKLLEEFGKEMMGNLAGHFTRFPLLLKFLDCQQVLSVQVHPSDDQKQYIPPGDTGKTEAWVVLETTAKSRIYAGLQPGTNAENLEEAIAHQKVADKLHCFIPKKGDAVFINSGTVHTLCGSVVFEVQENSDVTFRLYDWDRVDPKTKKPRNLQVAEALACIDFKQVNIGAVTPVADQDYPDIKEQLFNCEHFILWRIKSNSTFKVGMNDEPHILVCIHGKGEVTYNGLNYQLNKGDVILLPASVGKCACQPKESVTLLEIALPALK